MLDSLSLVPLSQALRSNLYYPLKKSLSPLVKKQAFPLERRPAFIIMTGIIYQRGVINLEG